MNLDQQREFIESAQFDKLKDLTATTSAKWGKMNSQQMIEHLDATFRIATEKIPTILVTPEEHIPKYLEFLYSEKQFRENTKAPIQILGEEPNPVQFEDLDIAILQYTSSVDDFIAFFSANADKKTVHPVFGWLNFEQWIILQNKHIAHHFRQFNLL